VNRFQNMKLSVRLILLAVCFIVGFLTFGYFSYRTLDVVKVNGPVYKQIVQSKDVVADVLPPPEYIIESYLLVLELNDETDAVAMGKLFERGKKLRREYEERHEFWLQDLAPGPLKQAMTDRAYRPAMAFFEIRDNQFVPAMQAGDRTKAHDITRGPLKQLYEEHRVAIDDVVAMATKANVEQEKHATEIISRDSLVLLIIAGMVVVVVFFISTSAWQIATSLITRIQLAADAANQVAGGDLTAKLPASADDETGKLLQAIKAMTENLNSLVNRVKQSSIEIMSTATQIAATSRSQQETVTSFGTSTTEIAAATKEISATSQELLTTMEGVNQVASNTSTLAEHGRAGITGMDGIMRQLAASTTSISGKLSVIQEKAASINLAVTTITKVADQTNLLSVNAAIEAEKAGEYGLGFLVLAREIRRLADQSAVATLDIDRMVRQMQAAVSAGVMEMDKFTEEVRNGVKGSTQIAQQLGEIIEQVHTLSTRFEAVNEGMRSQSLGAKQISDAMGQLTEGARQTSNSVHEFNSATEHLRDAVAGLKEEISRFTVSSG
jgi:methyl-accepting chemotaxis protein WspA